MSAIAIASVLLQVAQSIGAQPLPEHDDTVRLELEPCVPAFVLVGVDRSSPTSVAVDRTTGGRGWSHVYIDPCRAQPDGSRVIVDYTVRRGVHFADPDTYADRRRWWVELDPVTAAELWGCVRGRLGQPLHVGPLLAGRDTAASCVGLVLACSPSALRRELAPLVEGPCISPNTLARYFGAPLEPST